MICQLLQIDSNILLWIQENIRNDFLTPFFKIITTLGDNGYVWFVISLVLLISNKTRKIGCLSLLAILSAVVVDNVILKPLVERTRPYEVVEGLTRLIGIQKDFSFPSGHTGCSFAAAVVLFRGLPKKYGIPSIILAFLIGFSRLYLGVHYPSDVICGALIGTTVALLVWMFGKRYDKEGAN